MHSSKTPVKRKVKGCRATLESKSTPKRRNKISSLKTPRGTKARTMKPRKRKTQMRNSQARASHLCHSLISCQ